MAGEGGNRTHLSTCMDKPVLKTGRATRPYPPPLIRRQKPENDFYSEFLLRNDNLRTFPSRTVTFW